MEEVQSKLQTEQQLAHSWTEQEKQRLHQQASQGFSLLTRDFCKERMFAAGLQ